MARSEEANILEVASARTMSIDLRYGSRLWLWLACGAAMLALVAVLVLTNVGRTPGLAGGAPTAASLKKLPGRPEDIEDHGPAARSVLPETDARKINASVAFWDGPLRSARPFRFAGSDADRARARMCLAAAVLYEAGDDAVGEAAVAQVVLNRVRHPAFPNTVCGVVYQGAQRSTGCQFTFTCDGSLRRQMSASAWRRARDIAERALDGHVDKSVGLATHYHTDWVYPYWSPELRKLARVGTHLFFSWPGAWGGPAAFVRGYRGGEPDVAVPATVPDDGVPSSDLRPDVMAGGEGSAVPGVGGFQFRPARLPKGRENTPLYGNRLRLIRADAKAFGLLAGPDATAAKLVNAALALCADPGECQVQAWSHEDDIPGAYPIPAATRGTMVFEYLRGESGSRSAVRFDCARFPNKDPKLCLHETAEGPSALSGVRWKSR